MPGEKIALAVIGVTLLVEAAPAGADTTQLGAWFGPRVYSNDSLLGHIDDAPFHPVLQNSIGFGVRVARPFFPWLVPELELAMASTETNAVGGAPPADVFWLEPRLHLRIELMPGKRVQPFLVVGGGSPIAISGARQRFATGIVGDGYAGGGIKIDTGKSFAFRLDARVSLGPGVDALIVPEFDFGFGLEFHVGGRRSAGTGTTKVIAAVADRDGDGIPDAVDKCPDRPEDKDGFEDEDGCPDIDNDLDRVLDIADKCPNEPETYNGFEDEDGCPDTVPPEVATLSGTIEGLIYAEGETAVRDAALAAIQKHAATMKKYPTVRITLTGHSDDREAKQFATQEPDQPPPDLAALAVDLSRARAEAVKQELAKLGIAPSRIVVDGVGSEESVADNATPRGRLANRRVEMKLYVPPR
ncbi:MAG: OmpA family protein [Deltaproteobacteria bacterium]|nr:OmpA family protein [Deltaproteobacteria bacterium]MCW5804544.1 OmpA family protein [Deltaproteobacteria bacterium]